MGQALQLAKKKKKKGWVDVLKAFKNIQDMLLFLKGLVNLPSYKSLW